MKFEVFGDGSGAFSGADEAECVALNQFMEMMASFDKQRLGRKRFIAMLERCISQTPTFLDPYQVLASLNMMEGKSGKALKLAQRGLAVADALLPSGFDGRIPWNHEGNHSYLTLTRTLVTCLSGMRQHKDAARHAARMLALDPDDGACVRFTAGHEMLRAREEEHAQHLFRDYAHEYPPFCYELGFTLFQQRQLVAAATAFRRGIAANPYIALVLFTGQSPNAFPVAHINWWEGPEAAVKYLGAYGDIWDDAAEVQRFLYWLFNHSKVMAERAAMMACKEERPFVETPGADDASREREVALVDAIDDTVSATIVRQRVTPSGMLWPWDTYQGAAPAHTLH
ncbi:hypothetical protein [Pseudoduganella sp. OTU4001]|uniref:hypothetical protein n=1 Tax=Pseudoduganella sp. OTU4001 TaxID=3043854 RepID=UPI00313B52AE